MGSQRKQADFSGLESGSAAFFEARQECLNVANSVGMSMDVLQKIWQAPSASPFNAAMTRWAEQFGIVYDELGHMADELKKTKGDFIIQEEVNREESNRFMKILG